MGEAAKEAKIDIDFLNLGLEEFSQNQMRGLEDTVPLLRDYSQQWEQMANVIQNALTNTIGNALQMFGESLVSGKFDVKAFASMVLETFASMAEQLGMIALSVGFAVEAIKEALTKLQGPVAIAAGVALLALAGVARGAVAKLADSGEAPKLARGG